MRDASSGGGVQPVQDFAACFAASPWPMLMLDATGGLLAASDPARAQPGTLAQRLPAYLHALRVPPPWTVPLEAWCEHARADGTLCCERLLARPTPWGAALTVMPAAEAALPTPGAAVDAQTARLAALGFMVAGVCHEVTNPLTSLHSIVQILRADAGRTPALLDKGLANIANNVRRILDISRRLVTFSRVGDEPRVRFAVDDAVDEALVLLRQQALLSGVEVERRRDDLALVTGRIGQVREIFVNLLVNAVHAMVGGGRLQVHTRVLAGAVAVDVADDGPGVPPPLRERIFEPFFTTRGGQGGTGLGLAISREIAIEQGGSIELLDVSGRGAVFRVSMPRAA